MFLAFLTHQDVPALIEDSIADAIKSYEKVVDLENGEKGEWYAHYTPILIHIILIAPPSQHQSTHIRCRGFKALKKIVKLNFKTGKFENMLTKYKLFLTYTKSAVTSNYSEKGINSILDLASTSTDLDLIQQVYDITLKSLLDAKNEV